MQWVQLGYDIVGDAINAQSGYSNDLSSDGLIVAIGAPYDNNSTGQVKIYQYNNDWVQLGQTINGEGETDQSGYSVALSSDGSIVAIGSPYNTNIDKGHVRVYKYNNSTWDKLGGDINGESENDKSGWSVSLSSDGSIVAIGAPFNDNNGMSNAGQVRVYQYSNTDNNWDKLGGDINGEAANNESGYSIDLSSDGSIVAIGAPHNNNSTGQVKIYKYDDNSWTQLGQDINGEGENNQSGYSVALSSDGSIVAIGAPYNTDIDKGHVRVYKYTNGIWEKMGGDINGESENDKSGWSVSLSSDGSIVAIGAPFNDGNDVNMTNSGQVRIYKYNNDIWTQIGRNIDGDYEYNYSGWSVSLSSDGSFVSIGADLANNTKGHVKVYQWPVVTINNNSKLLNFMNSTSTYGNITNSLNIDYDLVAENYKVLTGNNITITKSM